MINLGLARIGLLVRDGLSVSSWKAVHVAGTNGKGSICAYLSALLHQSGGHDVGRFTSPHLIDRWDCITLNGKSVSRTMFMAAEKEVHARNERLAIGASEFELLTATAFELFGRWTVKYGVVEVGLGGRDDATNVLENKAVTVISKIGLDHQNFLGDTLEEIAVHKAGVMRPGVPCVVDASNPPSVLEAVRKHADSVGASMVLASPSPDFQEELSSKGFAPHQIQNLVCAHEAFRIACPERGSTPFSNLLPIIQKISWPGRLQTIDVSKFTQTKQTALLDGAHNLQSAEALSEYVKIHVRDGSKPVTWVLAASAGKDVSGILKLLLQPHDRMAAVRFGPVDGMPWVAPENPEVLLRIASNIGLGADSLFMGDGSIEGALKWAASQGEEKPMVIAGSLYLVGDILRLLREQSTQELD